VESNFDGLNQFLHSLEPSELKLKLQEAVPEYKPYLGLFIMLVGYLLHVKVVSVRQNSHSLLKSFSGGDQTSGINKKRFDINPRP
jgi:hypothetical protein